jgi:hypothetical protein
MLKREKPGQYTGRRKCGMHRNKIQISVDFTVKKGYNLSKENLTATGGIS